ncbi:Ig-like domain-containing protein [Alteromonas sp. C1M14]|uniref:Ig-like domain-containing protein n=1 Tax=Alteromonas sp. C1M14 TaxID=2841567 RepID=UPI001C0A3CA5|nr:Ig-like domain-containing protein [Alteromonas sp. C1M14]MBU2976697.1 Ig-like domain-containing protein [Alteromonas sp. C1M14]
MKTLSKSLTLFSMLFLLFACGGGDSLERDSDTSTGSDDSSDSTYTVSLSVVNQNNETDRDLATDNPLNIVVTVTDDEGAALADTLVTFTLSNDELANFSNDTGTARTDDSGQASIGLTVGTSAGDGQITATLPDGTTGTTTFTSAGTAVVSEEPAKVELYASSLQLASSGSDEIELIAVVKNAQSNLMEGVEVSFSASINDNVEIQQVDDETLENGTATAYVTTLNDASQREVTITATAGDEVASVTFEVVGTEVTINGATAITINDSTELTIRVQDSDGNNLTNQDVDLTTSLGELSTTTANTGTEGQDTVTFTATESGVATITAAALGVESQFTVTVQEDEFAFTTVPDDYIDVAPDNDYEDGDYATLTLTWKKDNVPFPAGEVTFTASRGDIRDGDESGFTDGNGEISFDIASTNAGVSTITATGVDSDGNSVTATVVVEFVATVADSLYADASPDQIGPDGQTSTITAVVRDPAGNLVKDKVVSFTVDDTSTGTISPSQSTTNSSGIASTVFTSAAVTSEDAVVITASVLDDTAVTDSVTLTVGNRAFDVSIGTGNEISKPDTTTYLKEFAVFVTDAVGQPIEGVELTASLTPVKYTNGGQYYKGYWVWVDPNWVVGYIVEDSDGEEEIVYGYTSVCDNEDINANGILDLGEDNNNDTFLTPGIVGSLSFQDGVTTTDENGQATLELRYPREYAAFYEAEIAVFAQSTGSEASASMEYLFGIAAEDVANESLQPQSSPFGTAFMDCSSTD